MFMWAMINKNWMCKKITKNCLLDVSIGIIIICEKWTLQHTHLSA